MIIIMISHLLVVVTVLLDFKIGDRVSFQPEGRGTIVGILTRYNKKTVTVISEAGERWNVAPMFLRKVIDASTARAGEAKVVSIRNT